MISSLTSKVWSDVQDCTQSDRDKLFKLLDNVDWKIVHTPIRDPIFQITRRALLLSLCEHIYNRKL